MKLTKGNKRCTMLKTLLVLYFILCRSYLHAQFDTGGVGARPIGLGNAFTALTGDTYSIYYNPAGLTQLYWKEFIVDYGKLYYGLDDNSNLNNGFVAYAQPISTITSIGTAGLSWLSFNLAGYYAEDTFTASYSKNIVKTLSVGINLKFLSKEYRKTAYTENAVNLNTGQIRSDRDPVFGNGYKKTNLTADVGLMWNFAQRHYLGMAVFDITQPDMGLLAEDKLPLSVRLGYAYKVYKGNVSSDITIRGKDLSILCGAERYFADRRFGVRAGLGIGSREYANISLGATYRYDTLFQIDYAFRYPLTGISDFLGSHQVSLTVRFGVPPTEQPEVIIKTLEQELKKAKEEAEVARKEAIEVPRLKETEEKVKQLEEELRRIRERRGLETEEEKRQKAIEAYWHSGFTLYQKGKYDEAIYWLEKLLQLNPEHAESKRLLEQAKQKIEEEKKKKEEEQKNKILKTYWNRAFSLYQKGKYDEAAYWFQKVLKINPQHKPSLRYLAACKKKIKLDKEEAEKYYISGLKLYHACRLEEAIKKWEQGLKFDPENEKINTALKIARKELQLQH